MDSSSDSYMEVDDEVYLCKMCDKVLEEGRAFELGGNRWHVECFRCSSCDAQLDCDTNLLVLGNGDLICGNCCYSCCVCGKKIDDLAILTGKDTAFCAKCFKCRNCKRPIENLRYARTSQGIFCMSCNEKLIERRRRNKLKEQQSGSRRAKSKTQSTSTITNVTTESIKDDSITVATITTTVLESKNEQMATTSSTDSTYGRRSTSPPVLDKSLPPVPKDEPPQSVVRADTLRSGDTKNTSTADTVTHVIASTENNLVKPVTPGASTKFQEMIIAETKEDESPSTVNTGSSSPSSETIPRFAAIGSSMDGKNSSTRFSVTTSAILDTYRDSYVSSASSTTELHSDRTIRAVPAEEDDSPTDIDEVNDTPTVVSAQPTDPAGDATRRSSAGLAPRANAEKVAYDTTTEDAAQEGLTASITSTTSNGSAKYESRRASVSSVASTSTLASFTRSSKGFLSDLSNRRSKTSFLTSKVRRISRSITIDMSNANSHSRTTGASFMTATTPSSAVSAPPDFSFPRRQESQSPAIPQQPLSPPLQSRQQQHEDDTSEALSLVPTPTSLSFRAPGNEALQAASDGPASRKSTTDGNTLPMAPVDSSEANKMNFSYSSMLIEENPDGAPLLAANQRKGHEPKRSISSASVGVLFSNSKNPFNRSHGVSLSQASTESTSAINGGSNQQKRSPFLFSGQFSAKQKDPATKDKSVAATSTLKKLGGIAKSPKAKSPNSPPRTPEKTATGLLTGTAKSLAPGPEISSSPAIRSSTDTEAEFGARKAKHSNYIPLPAFQDNTDFSLEEDFRNILNSQDQLAQSSPRSPRSPSRGVGVRAQRLQNLLRRPSRSTLRSFVTGAESSPATTYQTPGSPDSMHKWTQSPYISPEDVPTFMMVANERSSVLGAHDNDDSELSPPRRTLDIDDETAKLKYELVRASQRIVELEALLKIGEPDTTALEKTIEERRRTIADLEAQTTVIRKEYEVMRVGQAAEDEYDEAPNELLRRFRDEMEATKNGLQAEIQELISQRNELLDENLRLTKLRQDAVQQAEHLNAKNQELADLNNELTRQIQERFKTHKGSPSIGSSSSGGGLFGNLRPQPSREQFSIDRDGVSKPAYVGRSKALGNASPGPGLLAPSSASASPTVATENMPRESSATGSISAVLEEALSTDATTEVARPVYSFQPSLVNSGNSISNGGGKKKFWHRGGVAVAKGAVKGFNKMFSSDGGNSSGQWSSSGNGVDTIAQDSGATGGLNILMPTSASASSGLSTAGNNSSIPGGIMRTMKVTVPSGAANEQGADEPESSLFGVDIVKRTESEGRSVPFIVTRCIQEVESRGMDYEGIYRKSGIKSQSDMIQSMFEKCGLGQTLSPMTNEGLSSSSSTASLSSASLDEKDKIGSANPDVGVILTPEMIKWQDEFHELMQGDICGVTSALKQYLRHLPVPLVTYDSYAAFIAVAEHDDFERRIYRLTQIMKSLPRAHQNCLECIVRHLSRVVTHSDKNLMTALNLAVVFAPTLVWDYSGTREMMDAHKRNEVIRFMIENSDRIFATDVSLV
ncbi:hypothetical protein V1504DRAFT_450603 [Lipomyces starkeyi]